MICENPSVKTERFSPITTPARLKKKKSKSARMKMKSPGSDRSDHDVGKADREMTLHDRDANYKLIAR